MCIFQFITFLVIIVAGTFNSKISNYIHFLKNLKWSIMSKVLHDNLCHDTLHLQPVIINGTSENLMLNSLLAR